MQPTYDVFSCFRSTIHYTEAMELLKNIDPPLGFGKKCPDKMAYKRLIRMNMPIDKEGRVTFTTTLFALIRDNLKINVRESAEMDQADLELRATIMKVWPVTRAGKIDMLVPTEECKINFIPLFSSITQAQTQLSKMDLS